MILTPEQRFLIDESVMPQLTFMGLWAHVDRVADPEDADYVQDSLVVFGSQDGPYKTAKRVGAMLISIDPAFADLLVSKWEHCDSKPARTLESWSERCSNFDDGALEYSVPRRQFRVSHHSVVAA